MVKYYRLAGFAAFALAMVVMAMYPVGAFAQTPESVSSIITAASGAATDIVSAAQIGILVVASSAIGLGLLLLRRAVKAGR